jgi:hypothetical protein
LPFALFVLRESLIIPPDRMNAICCLTVASLTKRRQQLRNDKLTAIEPPVFERLVYLVQNLNRGANNDKSYRLCRADHQCGRNDFTADL